MHRTPADFEIVPPTQVTDPVRGQIAPGTVEIEPEVEAPAGRRLQALALEEAVENDRHALMPAAHDELFALPGFEREGNAPSVDAGHSRLGNDRSAGNRRDQMLHVDESSDRGF